MLPGNTHSWGFVVIVDMRGVAKYLSHARHIFPAEVKEGNIVLLFHLHVAKKCLICHLFSATFFTLVGFFLFLSLLLCLKWTLNVMWKCYLVFWRGIRLLCTLRRKWGKLCKFPSGLRYSVVDYEFNVNESSTLSIQKKEKEMCWSACEAALEGADVASIESDKARKRWESGCICGAFDYIRLKKTYCTALLWGWMPKKFMVI